MPVARLEEKQISLRTPPPLIDQFILVWSKISIFAYDVPGLIKTKTQVKIKILKISKIEKKTLEALKIKKFCIKIVE